MALLLAAVLVLILALVVVQGEVDAVGSTIFRIIGPAGTCRESQCTNPSKRPAWKGMRWIMSTHGCDVDQSPVAASARFAGGGNSHCLGGEALRASRGYSEMLVKRSARRVAATAHPRALVLQAVATATALSAKS